MPHIQVAVLCVVAGLAIWQTIEGHPLIIPVVFAEKGRPRIARGREPRWRRRKCRTVLVSSLKNQLRRLDDFFASLSVRSSDVDFFAKCLFETNVNGLSFVSARLPEWVDHGMRCAPGGTKFSVGKTSFGSSRYGLCRPCLKRRRDWSGTNCIARGFSTNSGRG
jgi:hypothetical protein